MAIICKNCKTDLGHGQIICDGMLCLKCWEKSKAS